MFSVKLDPIRGFLGDPVNRRFVLCVPKGNTVPQKGLPLVTVVRQDIQQPVKGRHLRMNARNVPKGIKKKTENVSELMHVRPVLIGTAQNAPCVRRVLSLWKVLKNVSVVLWERILPKQGLLLAMLARKVIQRPVSGLFRKQLAGFVPTVIGLIQPAHVSDILSHVRMVNIITDLNVLMFRKMLNRIHRMHVVGLAKMVIHVSVRAVS